jgi:hypothetical protein
MASSFPQLLKRSAFAAHDSLITRVYASTPQSAALGDWGLKGVVHRAKGSKYVKVAELDSKMGIGATWTSAEGEARFMSMWGDGSVAWDTKTKRQPRASIKEGYEFAEELPEPTTSQMLPNVESMTEPEFERYLAYIRKHREELRESMHADGGRASGAAPEESTLTHAAARGATREVDSSDFQANLITREFTKKGSERLQARPHHLHGLSYSTPLSGGSKLDASRAHKGRVLDRTATRSQYGAFRDGTNSKWVVGLGGLTAHAASGTNRIADKASLSQFDYKRERPQAGISYFAINDATLKAPPRVVGLRGPAESGERWINNKISSATRPAPLKSFKFDIDVQEAPAPEAHTDLGSSEWVARERSRGSATSMETDLGILGSRRNGRPRGAGAAAASRLSKKVASENIDNLLAKLQSFKKE